MVRRRDVALWAIVSSVVVSVGACDNGSDRTREAELAREYSDAYGAVGTEFVRTLSILNTDMEGRPQRPDETTVANLVADAVDDVEAQIAQMNAIDPPSRFEDEHEDMVDAMKTFASDVVEVDVVNPYDELHDVIDQAVDDYDVASDLIERRITDAGS